MRSYPLKINFRSEFDIFQLNYQANLARFGHYGIIARLTADILSFAILIILCRTFYEHHN